MQKIDLTPSVARASMIESVSAQAMTVVYGKNAGGVSLPGTVGTAYRYIIGDIKICEEHCVAFMLRFYAKGEDKARLVYRFGLLPGIKTRVRFDLTLMDNHTIYTTRTPGMLKLVCHGHRIDMDEVEKIELGIEKTFQDVRVELSDFYMDDAEPTEFPLPDVKLVDDFGQWKNKDWPGKAHSYEEMEAHVRANEGPTAYPFAGWNKWGGYSGHKIKEGTGFFSTAKADGRWYLVDPDGCSFFSLGACGVGSLYSGDRVDGVEKFCDWLPARDSEFAPLYAESTRRRTEYMPPEHSVGFNFAAANLMRVYGANYMDQWKQNYNHILSLHGLNTTGSHPTFRSGDMTSPPIPYVHQIGTLFPATKELIFRDFPDVLSQEYRDNAVAFAQQLLPFKDDPMLIGYFMRNEPEFNFVEDIVIADEVLYNPYPSACRNGLKCFLMGRYGTIEKLNAAWGSDFASFAAFDGSIRDASKISKTAEKDLREYSVYLVREYVRIPAEACRKVDPHHLNLGLRWSKAYNADMCAGWEYCDVFSINCYSFDPTIDMNFAVEAGVDCPILIGEFHFGALDRGLPATGLKGVENQEERAKAWRMFAEKCAEHPYGVGVHWFQFHDQFVLGRQDGENYQIGIVDVTTQPYKELADAMDATAQVIYAVRRGETPAFDEMPKAIPMIGY